MELRAYLEKRYGKASGAAIHAFAEECEHSIYAVRKWLSKDRCPRPPAQMSIKEITGGLVGAEDWWPSKAKSKHKKKKNGASLSK